MSAGHLYSWGLHISYQYSKINICEFETCLSWRSPFHQYHRSLSSDQSTIAGMSTNPSSGQWANKDCATRLKAPKSSKWTFIQDCSDKLSLSGKLLKLIMISQIYLLTSCKTGSNLSMLPLMLKHWAQI